MAEAAEAVTRGGPMKSLAGSLASITTGPTSPAGVSVAPSRSPSPWSPSAAKAWSSSDDDVCRRCSAELPFDDEGRPVPHRCCACLGAGFVRLQKRRGEEGFGKAVACPECAKQEPTPEESEREVVRLRIPAKFRDCRIGTWQPDNGRPRLAAQSYVARWPPEKPLLLFTGSKGVGKTHLAAGIVREVFERHGQRGQFWPVVDLLDRFRATYDDDRATETIETVDQQLRQLAVLVLDDFGTHKSTEWAEERLFRLIDERYRDLRPLVVTTNLGLLELPDRVKSRLTDSSTSTLVNVAGTDRRGRA